MKALRCASMSPRHTFRRSRHGGVLERQRCAAGVRRQQHGLRSHRGVDQARDGSGDGGAVGDRPAAEIPVDHWRDHSHIHIQSSNSLRQTAFQVVFAHQTPTQPMLRVAIRLVADAALVAILLFTTAETLAWWRAWVLVVVLLGVRAAGARAAYRVNPALVLERAKILVHREQSRTDRVLLLAVLATGFLGLPVLAALDVFRWRVWPLPAPRLSDAGLLLFVLGWSLKSLALRENAFATAAVRLQRAHVVADTGVYGVVRHPFYAADPLVLVGLGLWSQSYVAVLGAALPVALMVIRLRMEERFLCRALPGYHAYVLRVRYRLIPGVW